MNGEASTTKCAPLAVNEVPMDERGCPAIPGADGGSEAMWKGVAGLGFKVELISETTGWGRKRNGPSSFLS